MVDPRTPSTIREFIQWVAQRLSRAGVYFGHGTDNAMDEAAWLVGGALKLSPHELAAHLDDAPRPAQRRAIGNLIERRITTRKPLAYLLKEAWFAGLKFYVDARVLVPRSIAGEYIRERFAPWLQPGNVHRALDLCTGSGCIAVALAHAFPQARVDAVDISNDALAVARINVESHGLSPPEASALSAVAARRLKQHRRLWQPAPAFETAAPRKRAALRQRVRLVKSDLFEALAGNRYDLIVTNPPYVARADMATLPEEYRHEPELALAAGEHGLDVIVKILAQAADYLTPGGILVAEVGNSHAALAAAFPQAPFLWLTSETGDESVFLLTAAQLAIHAGRFVERTRYSG